MNIKYRTCGFVFKKNELAESDQVFSVFTKDFGNIAVRAKSIRKTVSKLRPHIDIFYWSEIEFIQGKNYKTLTDALIIKKFNSGALNLATLKVMCQMAEVMDSFLKGQDRDDLAFDLIGDVWDGLHEGAFTIKNHELVFQYFFWNFISLQGYHLQAHHCSHCEEKLDSQEIYFSGKEGGMICKQCIKAGDGAQKINTDVVKVLRLILQKDWLTIVKLKIELPSQRLLEDICQNAIHAFSPVHS